VYSAGNGISITLGSIALNTPVTVASGGTGLTTSPANGQLLIGNGSNYTLSTLTAGSGVSITNSAGSITLSATGLGGTVTAVTATGPLASSGGTTPDISIANSTGTGSVVLDQGATISSATITAAVSASITTITGTSANITTVTGTTAGFSSANITQLGTTSATITTLSGTNVTYSSGTVSQLAATSATIASVSGTNVTYSNGNLTSATVTTISGTTATYTSGTVTNLNSTSANITTLTGTTFGTTATTQLRGASAQITTLTSTSANITTITGTTLGTFTSGTVTNLNSTSANITTLTGTTFGTTATTQIRANSLAVSATGARWDVNGDIWALRSGGTTGVVYLNSAGSRYLYWDNANYTMPGANLFVNGVQAVTNSGTWAISVSGNAATVTDGMYLASVQTVGGRKAFSSSQNVGTMLTASGSLGGLEAVTLGGANAAFMSFHRAGAYASYFGIDTDNQFAVGGWSAGAALANFKCLSLGVGTAASGTSGEIRATNNVTAYYSDARLKDFKGKIGDALYKVSQLNGYYYTENEKAEEFGFKNKELQVGVSAQEVKAILPEVIAPAPFDMDAENKSKSGEDYMTVRYEKLVPLLIEAIKELKAEVEALKAAK
jgi:hypothetical protein